MNRFLLALTLCLAICVPVLAQQSDVDAPASKEDVQRYLDAMNSREMMRQMVEAMSKPMHQMVHDQYVKDKDKLPPDFEEQMNKVMDDMFREMPWNDILQAMAPAYEKHLTKGDIDNLVAFYSSPTGQKLLREMPAIMGEAMQTAMPIIQKYVDGMNQLVQQQMAQMLKDPGQKAGKGASTVAN